jgi:long-subunit fatty acid transport protein
VQVGNFGFTLYGLGQSAFQVVNSPVIDALLNISIPDNINDPQQLANAILSLEGLFQPIAEGASFNDALPFAYSVSYVDLVGAAGYAYDFSPDLSIGLNLKVINRRFSAKKIYLEQYNDILNILKRDLNQSITGFTFDLGGLFKLPFGTQIGLDIQNIIPIAKITSTMSNDVSATGIDYKRDTNGNIVLNAQGDTVLQSVYQNYQVSIPFDLKLPMVINFGLLHPITENWDVAFDWDDISKQDFRYEDYLERFNIGTEYRLDAIKDMLGAAFRVGMAEKHFTGGIGFDIYKALQLDGAYAYDTFVESYSYYVQLRLGW